MNLAAHVLHHPNPICEALLSVFLCLSHLPCFFKIILLALRKREDGQSSTEISIDHLDSRFSCHRLVTHHIPWDWDKCEFLDHICLQILAATSNQWVTLLRGNVWHVLDPDWRTHFHGTIHKKQTDTLCFPNLQERQLLWAEYFFISTCQSPLAFILPKNFSILCTHIPSKTKG